jgi:hypothetical protein
MRWSVPKMALVAAALALGACQEPDVGQPCRFSWGNPETYPVADRLNPACVKSSPECIKSEWFESGNTECENLVCIMSPVTGGRYASGAYCSKPCVSNSDCYEEKTGLVCRQIVLDPLFLQQLDSNLKQKYLGETQFSSYCTVPP